MNTTTPILSLTQVQQGNLPWDTLINGDLGIIDSFAGSVKSSLSSISGSVTGLTGLTSLTSLASLTSLTSLSNFSLNGTTGSISLVAGANITLNSGASSITIVGASAGGGGNVIQPGTSATSAGTIVLVGGNNITLATGVNSITISGPAVPAATNFSLNGSSSSVSLVAGTNIGLSSSLSTITISVTGLPAATNFSLNGSSSSASLVAGAGISFSSSLSTITVSNTASTLLSIASVAGGTTTGTVNTASSTAFAMVAGSFVTLSQNSTSPNVTIYGPNQSILHTINSVAGGTTTGTVNTASSSAFALVAGSFITLSQNSTGPNITIYGPSQSVLFSITSAAGGTTTGTINTASSSALSLCAGSFITLSQNSTNPAVTILAANQSVLRTIGSIAGGTTTGTANTASSTAWGLYAGSNITLSQASTSPNVTILGVGTVLSTIAAGAGTTSGTVNTASSTAFGLVAGASINLSQASTSPNITISAANQSVLFSITSAAGGTTTGTINTASSSNLSLVAGSFITLSQNSTNPAVTISAANQSILHTIAAGAGATSGTVNTASSTAFGLVAGANITLSQVSTSPNITISAPAPGAGGSVLTTIGSVAGGTSSGTLNTASSTAFGLVAGNGINLSQNSTSPNITVSWISDSGNITLSVAGNTAGATSLITGGSMTLYGGNDITLSQSGQSISISGGGIAKLSWQPLYPMQNIDGQVLSKSAAASGALGFGSSLFLQRMTVRAMTLTEVDMAMGISFSATNSGQGSMSQTFIIYSFGNSTSLASVASISGTSSWSTGTAAGGAPWTSIQGGWSGNLIHPITFAASAVAQGEYIFGHLFELSMATSGHSVAIYGDVGLVSSVLTAFSAAPTVASAFSTGGLVTGSIHASSTNVAATVFLTTPTAVSALTGGLSSFGSALRMMSYATSTDAVTMGASASGVSIAGFSKAATASFGTIAGSYHTASGTLAALANASTGAASLLSAGGFVTGSVYTATAGVNAISNAGTTGYTVANGSVLSFGFIGTASASTNMNVFVNGILSTGAVPTSIALTNAALSYGGNVAWQQPWFQLCGS